MKPKQSIAGKATFCQAIYINSVSVALAMGGGKQGGPIHTYNDSHPTWQCHSPSSQINIQKQMPGPESNSGNPP